MVSSLAVVSALAMAMARRSGAAEAADTLKLAVGAPATGTPAFPRSASAPASSASTASTSQLLYTNGGGETMQAVISGSVDIGIAAGTGAVIGAFAKGAPVRIIAAGVTGASDLYWYVPAASPIRSLKDAAGKTVAYSTNGASTHVTLLALIKHFDVKARPVATGASAVTFTQAMSSARSTSAGRRRRSGSTRSTTAASGSSRAAATCRKPRDQTVRVHIVNADVLAARPRGDRPLRAGLSRGLRVPLRRPAGARLFRRHRQGVGAARGQIRDTFLPKAAMAPDRVSGTEASMADAVAAKMLPAPLTAAQLDQLIRIPPPH